MHGINPIRLRQIRIVRNIKLEQLAANLGITKQAVSKYEHGKSVPSTIIIDRILNVFGISRQYVCKNNIDFSDNCSPLFFKKSNITTKSHIDYADIISQWAYEIIFAIENKTAGSPDFLAEKNLSIAENVMQLRNQWSIGNEPVKNLTELLEQQGFYVFVIDSAQLGTEAYSRIINGIPIIIINKNKMTVVKWRYNLAHELGHLVLHSGLSDEDFQNEYKRFEREADIFAQYFLMSETIFKDMIVSLKLKDILFLKEVWKVPVDSILCYCKELGIIDCRREHSLKIQMSSQGWKKNEPLDDRFEMERPHKIINSILMQVISDESFNSFYDKVCLPLDEIERICSLPAAYLSAFETDIVKNRHNQREAEQLTLFQLGGENNA